MEKEKEILGCFNADKCPYCGGRHIGYGSQNGYAAISPKGHPFRSAMVYHVVCADCGAILYSCVNKPELFMPKQD